MTTAYNLLVISDLHLGEDLGMSPSETLRHHVDETELGLVAFLDHYASVRQDALPWKLVINGDMIDFLSVALLPHDSGIEGNALEREFGFGASQKAAVAKFERVANRHVAFFDALARFAQSGHSIDVVAGNHDAEFHFVAVRDAFRAAVNRRASAPIDLRFHAWFFFEPGFAYIEHGHQYDPFCSFDDALTPEDPHHPGSLEENLGTAAMRYLGNHLPLDADAAADLSFVEYLHLISNAGVDLRKMLGGYSAVVAALAGQWFERVRSPRAFIKRRGRRRKRMESLAHVTGIDRKLLERLHRLRRPPVFLDLLQLVRAVMVGRLLSLVVLPPLLLLAFLLLFPVGLKAALLGCGGVAALFVIMQVWLAMGRDNVDPTETMRKTATKIVRLMGAPVVVFGHSHLALAHHAGDQGWYFNTGSWAGGADRNNAFTHLVVRRRHGKVRAALCRWRRGQSRELRVETAAFGKKVLARPVGAY